jgi:ubiquinone/menaquinone biosynthesis C-methylase UbiE
MGEHRRSYIPATGHDWLLPLYDPVMSLLGGDSARRELVEQSEIQSGYRVLDIGCGTGSLAVLISRLHPDTEVIGLDPDPKALSRAKRKAQRAAVSARFDLGPSGELPYQRACFDRVFSSFMLHHLGSDEKRSTLKEVRRILKPNGSLHVVDLGGPESRADGLLARLLHSADQVRENFEGRLLALMREAGFADASEITHRATRFGQIAYYRASVPASAVGAA